MTAKQLKQEPGMTIPCPRCPQRFEVSEEDPDGTLSDVWEHLGRHARDRGERQALFVKAQERAR